MKIYTKTGDKGETSLFGGERVLKDSLRIESYGTIDELNSFIGLAITEVLDKEILNLLGEIQNMLFNVGADLATPALERNKKLKVKRVSSDYAEEIEKAIDYFESKLAPLQNFILPGGSKAAAILHVCRTVARRAERRVIRLNNTEQVGENLIIFLNRLSDLFFVLSRFENKISKVPDITWK